MRSWLKEIRQSHNMTHMSVAVNAQIDRSTYTNIENGGRCPSVSTAKAIASVLGFDWTKFYEKEEEEGDVLCYAECLLQYYRAGYFGASVYANQIYKQITKGGEEKNDNE